MLHAPQGRRGSVVVACTESAAPAGIVPGIPLAEATGLLTTAAFLPADPSADAEGLANLARRCQRFTPRVAVDEFGLDSLLLDIAGCSHLFGGEAPLVRQVQDELRPFVTRVAIADTIGSAWALARYGSLRSAVRDLPIEGLRLPTDVLHKLRRLGLGTIGQVQALPRRTLPSRFGPGLLERLDQLTGRRPEIVQLVAPLDPFAVNWTAEDPVSDRSVLETVVHTLLGEVAAELQQRKQATQQVTCEFRGKQSHPPMVLRLTRPTTSAAQLRELAALQLERRRWRGEVTCVQVEAQPLPIPAPRVRTLFDDGTHDEQHLAILLDRLRNRCGEETVTYASLVNDWVPERSVVYRLQRGESTNFQGGLFPLRLYRQPQPAAVVMHQGRPVRLRWEQGEELVAEVVGPQRIESGWWRRQFIRRDYYRITTAKGRRLWLFQQRDLQAWFVCGE